MIYSHSRLNTFENCKLAFKFRYIDKIKTEFDGIEAFMGSRVHEALEHLYNKVKKGETPEIAEILKHYVNGWKKNFHKNVIIVKKQYTHEDYKKVGEKCLIDYYIKHHPFKENVIENEKRVIIDIDGIKLQGFIDRIDINNEIIEIHDYKTGGRLPTQKKIDKDRQLALYQLALEKIYPDSEFKLIWHYLVFETDLISFRTKEELEQLKEDIKKLVEKIENEREFLPTKSMLCNWCEYKNICPAHKNNFLETKNWKKEEEEKLVGEYVKLREELSRGKKKIDAVKRDIIEYSKQIKTKQLFDEEYIIKITENHNLVMPKNKKIENEMIRMLKEEGLYDKVTGINMTALNELLEENPSLQKKIRPLLNEETEKKLQLKKKGIMLSDKIISSDT